MSASAASAACLPTAARRWELVSAVRVIELAEHSGSEPTLSGKPRFQSKASDSASCSDSFLEHGVGRKCQQARHRIGAWPAGFVRHQGLEPRTR